MKVAHGLNTLLGTEESWERPNVQKVNKENEKTTKEILMKRKTK